ncbi:hypothetical protein RD792_016134 [Penstemon davidsonii]|uniref:Amino acid transporter transmembrane domain-containing protein n=1 Tax=Penstemon davidsonii TaxID=160366 RepID=A0ABR0CIS6_9LAMI|nr:hypothetical protein RD792_016134 [Penstemon davidsonii]
MYIEVIRNQIDRFSNWRAIKLLPQTRPSRYGCHRSNNPFILTFGLIQIVLSQIPNFHKLSILSIIAVGHVISLLHHRPWSLHSQNRRSAKEGMLRPASQEYLLEMIYQDTIKYGAQEKQVMKKATSIAISISTAFYMLCGILGYAAFANKAPGNFLTGFGFYDPFWLVDLANLCIGIHLVGAYQVFGQPVFGLLRGLEQREMGSK